MEENRLARALENLIARGDLSREDAQKITEEFERTSIDQDPRQKILSEVGGYLGGLFILIAVLILIGGRWQHISRYLQFSIFFAVAILLGAAAYLVGRSTPARSRLAGLLGAAASASITGALFAWKIHGDAPIFATISCGFLLTLASYIWNRTIVGEVALAGFALATGTAGLTLASHHFRGTQGFASVLLLVGTIWLILSNTGFFNRRLGDAIAISMFFIGVQLFFSFSGGSRFFSYLISAGTVGAAAWVYLRAPEWPLLVGAVASITVGTGELVGTTLGGSLGATLGLLTSGVIFVIASVFSFKRSKREDLTGGGDAI